MEPSSERYAPLFILNFSYKCVCVWPTKNRAKGVEERAEDRAEEEGPSSPLRNYRAVSPDIQFVSDHEAGSLESVRRHTSVQQSDSRAHPSEIRLADDQIEIIS